MRAVRRRGWGADSSLTEKKHIWRCETWSFFSSGLIGHFEAPHVAFVTLRPYFCSSFASHQWTESQRQIWNVYGNSLLISKQCCTSSCNIKMSGRSHTRESKECASELVPQEIFVLLSDPSARWIFVRSLEVESSVPENRWFHLGAELLN